MHKNILILSAGRRVSLVRAFQKAVQELELDSQVYCADMSPKMAAACHVADQSYTLPHCLADNYIESLLTLCQQENIAMVIPTIDTELQSLALYKSRFLAMGITIVVSDFGLVKQCRDKRLTHTLFENIGFPVPKCFELNALEFPCFAKPISGSLSQNIRVLQSQTELEHWDIPHDQMIYMEVISNDEYDEFTVDIYYDLQSEVKCIIPRQRVEVRGGEVSKGLTNKSIIPLIRSQLEKVTGAFGCLTLQIFKHKLADKIYGIEINPRFGGGFPLSNLAGGCYPKWLIQEVLLEQQIPYFDAWQDKLMMLRYDAEVIVENG